jgi:hypothetical protein
MWDLILEGCVVAVLRWLIVIVLTPVVLLVATPFIFTRAWFLAARGEQRFRFALEDGYESVWYYTTGAFIRRF